MENNYVYNITLLAPLPPPLAPMEPWRHHYISVDSYEMIRSDITEACDYLGIEKKDKLSHGYKCSSFKNQSLIQFYIDIYRRPDNTHIIEFQQLTGDNRFKFAEILYELQERLSCNIVGARRPETFDTIDFKDQDQYQMYDFMSEQMFSDIPSVQQEALQMLASCSRQLRHQNVKACSDRFVSYTSKIVLHAIRNAKNSLYLYVVSALADYFMIPTEFDDDIIQGAKQLTLEPTHGYHEKRETLRLSKSLGL
jgi:hypothetical protein